MTNFQPSGTAPKRWITPERAVFVLPILGGAALAVLLGVVVLSPLLVQLNQRRSVVVEMERKRDELPLLRQQLEALLLRQQILQTQQKRLLNLVAGTGALKTWLAQLNRLAVKQGVAILLVEPQPVEVYTPPPPPAEGAEAAAAPPPAPGDPLLAPNLEKRSAIVTLQAPFPRLVALLQQTELLQVIVLASDLELDLVPPQSGSQQVQTKLKLKFSAYGRSAKSPS